MEAYKLHTDYVSYLYEILAVHYDHRVCPAHDLDHSREMIRMARQIKAIQHCKTLDLEEFEVACIIHSTDRSMTLRELMGLKSETPFKEMLDRWKSYLTKLLSLSPFDDTSRERIIDAVLQHPKKQDDLEHDSVLLTALRIADKVVRFGPLGILSMAANHRDNPLYDRNQPFNYTSSVENKLKSVYNDFCRVLEWYGMLPFDEARTLIPMEYLLYQINFMRKLGKQIAEITEKANESENDIIKALGKYYETVVNA
jgi:hypothetical protein